MRRIYQALVLLAGYTASAALGLALASPAAADSGPARPVAAPSPDLPADASGPRDPAPQDPPDAPKRRPPGAPETDRDQEPPDSQPEPAASSSDPGVGCPHPLAVDTSTWPHLAADPTPRGIPDRQAVPMTGRHPAPLTPPA